MAKIEIETLTDDCFEYCDQVDIAKKPDGTLHCSKMWMCRCGALALYNTVLEKYENEARMAYGDDAGLAAGLKEHAVWSKAIRILEGCVPDES